jgi:hypothetical protein
MNTQSITNYVYEHPYVAGTAISAVTIGVFAPGLMIGGVTASIGAIAALPVLSQIAIAASAYTIFVKPYLDPYLTPYSIAWREFYKEHPYVTTAVTCALTAGSLYFGGAKIILDNLNYMWSHKLLSGVLMAVPAIEIATSAYLIGNEKTSKLAKECLDQAISIDLITGVCVEDNKAMLFVPSLGFYSSCVFRKAAREYYLTDEQEDLLEVFLVGFGSGAIAGSFKYGIKAFADGKTWGEIGVKAVIGAVNNGFYGFSAAINMENSSIKKHYNETLSQFDLLACLIVEPADSVVETGLKGSFPTLFDVASGLSAGSIMYIVENALLQSTEELTTAAIALSAGANYSDADIAAAQAIFINQTPIECKVAGAIDVVL